MPTRQVRPGQTQGAGGKATTQVRDNMSGSESLATEAVDITLSDTARNGAAISLAVVGAVSISEPLDDVSVSLAAVSGVSISDARVNAVTVVDALP